MLQCWWSYLLFILHFFKKNFDQKRTLNLVKCFFSIDKNDHLGFLIWPINVKTLLLELLIQKNICIPIENPNWSWDRLQSNNPQGHDTNCSYFELHHQSCTPPPPSPPHESSEHVTDGSVVIHKCYDRKDKQMLNIWDSGPNPNSLPTGAEAPFSSDLRTPSPS